MDIKTAIKERRSIRKYKDIQISGQRSMNWQRSATKRAD